MKNQILKTFCKMIITLIISAIVGTLLLSIAYSFPTYKIKNNVQSSVDQLVSEGDHFTIFSGLRYTDFDNYSDANYLNAAMVDNSARGFFTGLYGLEYENKNAQISYDSPVTVLANVFLNSSDLQYKEYGRRFWNGYEIFVKPLMMIFTYGQVRNINLYLEISLLMLLIILMHKRHMERFAIPLVISYLLLGPVTMASSMAFSGFIYCTYIPCVLIMLFNEKIKQKQLYPLFFMMIGICVAYFNMNYLQLISFAYALVFYCLMNGFPQKSKDAAVIFVAFFACWLMGFAGMYAMKWIVYELLTGLPLLSDMIARTLYRVSATAYYTGPHISRFYAVAKNIKNLILNIPWMAIELIFVFYMINKAKNSGCKLYESIRFNGSVVMLLLMVTLVFLRYFVFANHIYVHSWVTYRIADAAILLFNSVITDIVFGAKNEKLSEIDEI